VILFSVALILSLFPQRAWGQVPEPKTLRVATRVVVPFVTQEGDKLNGFSIELWNKIAEQLKMTSKFTVKPDVTGLLRTVESGQADVGIAAVSITSERDHRFDFSQPMFESGLQILVRGKGDSEGTNPVAGFFKLLFSPTMLVWLGIVAVMILVPAHILWLLERNHSEGIIPTKSYIPGIFHAAWWAAGTLATQADSMPRNGFARVMAILWMFTGVVFVAYFTAQVTASMTVEQLKGNIQGPSDLPGKHVATTRGSTAAQYLKEHHVTVHEYSQIDDAYQALQASEVDAVVFDAPVLMHYASHEGKGRVQTVGAMFRKENYGIVFPMGSPYRKPVQKALLALREDGTYDALYDKWFSGK
jgi:polar amino acid transport system substrate-binding protein